MGGATRTRSAIGTNTMKMNTTIKRRSKRRREKNRTEPTGTTLRRRNKTIGFSSSGTEAISKALRAKSLVTT